MTANFSVVRLNQIFVAETSGGTIASANAIHALLNAAAECVASLSGDHRLLAYTLRSFLCTLDEVWETNRPDALPFMRYAHQPIAAAIALLQNEAAEWHEIRSASLALIDAHGQLVGR